MMLQRSAAQNGQYSAPTYTIIGFPLASLSTVSPGSLVSSPGWAPEPTVEMTVGSGCSRMLATFAEIGTVVPALVPLSELINTITMSTTATMPTLTEVITVGDCHGGRRLSATERTAA